MPIGSILTAKDSASTQKPLLLTDITFVGGSVLRVCSDAVTYGGNAYLPRLLNHEALMSSALSEQGIDIPANVRLRLADPDLYLWANWEHTATTGRGFKGAEVTLTVVLWDAIGNTFSSDSRVIFRGVCKEPGGQLPQHDGKQLTVGFGSKLGLADVSLPPIRIQRYCPWSFPTTAADRQDGADNQRSIFYRCGYSPDATGGNARGDLDGGTGLPYTTCGFTKADCEARGMYSQDSSARTTGRFGGIQWQDTQASTVRGYVSGKWEQVQAGYNEARYGDNVPMLWGTAWTDPLVLNMRPDGNNLKMECLICYGQVDDIQQVTVNDYTIPHTYDDTEMSYVGPGVGNKTDALKGGWWKAVNKGDRNGKPNDDAGYDSLGDPYGSLCVIAVTVPRKIADVGSIPRVRVLARRGTGNPAEQISEILQDWCGWDSPDLNSTSFGDCAGLNNTLVSFTGPYGSQTRARFSSSLYLRQRESAADVIRGVRNCMRGLLGWDANGKLQLRMKATLADQHPNPVSGSNYTTGISSVHMDGTSATGYIAYRFTEADILAPPQVKLLTTGNRWSVQFQNADNRWNWDAFAPLDSADIARVDQEIPAQFTLRGADNPTQIQRLISTFAAEQMRGNRRGDTAGTLQISFPVSMKGLHLLVGDIVQVNWQPLGLTNQLTRVVGIAPETNWEKATITVQWHSDAWYVDSYGLSSVAAPGNPRNRELRPAYPWLPYGEQPPSGDAMFASTDWTFSIVPGYQVLADGTALAKPRIGGVQPVNDMSSINPPNTPLQGNTSSTGGSITGGRTYYIAFAAKDSAGLLSKLSELVMVAVPSGTSTNTITAPSLYWPTGTAGYVCYAGDSPTKLSKQAESSGTPSSVTLTTLNVATLGPPDGEFDRFRIRVKRSIHSGCWGALVEAVTSTTIKISGASFTTNQWAGYTLSCLAIDDNTEIPLKDVAVVSNTADTLTVASGHGFAVGDVAVMRSKPTYGTDGFGEYMEDANWVNCFAASGLTPDAEVGNVIRFIAGTGRGQAVRCTKNTSTRLYADFPVDPDSTSHYVVEEPNWQVISDTVPLANSSDSAAFQTEVDVSNYRGQSLVVQVLTMDGGDTESVESQSPVRDFYLFGAAGSLIAEGIISYE